MSQEKPELGDMFHFPRFDGSGGKPYLIMIVYNPQTSAVGNVIVSPGAYSYGDNKAPTVGSWSGEEGIKKSITSNGGVWVSNVLRNIA